MSSQEEIIYQGYREDFFDTLLQNSDLLNKEGLKFNLFPNKPKDKKIKSILEVLRSPIVKSFINCGYKHAIIENQYFVILKDEFKILKRDIKIYQLLKK